MALGFMATDGEAVVQRKVKMMCALMGLSLFSACSVGSDLTGKHYSCSTAEDCFDGRYCEPTLQICLLPDEDVMAFQDYLPGDTGGQERIADATAQDPGLGDITTGRVETDVALDESAE